MSTSQKIVIPKGLVNPNETTVIEIPVNLRHLNTVIAKPKQDFSYPKNRTLLNDDQNYPKTPPQIVTKRSYTRKTIPRARGVKMEGLYDGHSSFGGRPYEDPADESSHGFHPYVPKSPQTPEAGSFRDFRPNLGEHYYPVTSTPKPYEEMGLSPVAQSRRSPAQAASRGKAPCAPRAPCASGSSGPSGSPEIYKTSITTSSPGEISTTEITEERYPSSDYASPDISPPDPNFTYTSDSYDGSRTPGKTPDSSWTPPQRSGGTSGSASGAGGLTQSDMMDSLGNLEAEELQKIMGDLSDFQAARRRLVFDASGLASAEELSRSLMSSTS